MGFPIIALLLEGIAFDPDLWLVMSARGSATVSDKVDPPSVRAGRNGRNDPTVKKMSRAAAWNCNLVLHQLDRTKHYAIELVGKNRLKFKKLWN
jgi:hypothetical protein